MKKTYLYVDGENFTIRANSLQDELARNQPLRDDLTARAQRWAEDSGYSHNWASASDPAACFPRPRRAECSYRELVRALYIPGEIYWDPYGLYIAINTELFHRTEEERSELALERAYYYTTTKEQSLITARQLQLHALGFSPYIAQRVKPDSYTKQMQKEGMTIISRPKPMDIALAVQVLEDCTSDNFDRCIFVSGDEDYVPLLEEVRRRGKQVWVVAIEKTLAQNHKLRLACDRFIAYDPVLAVGPIERSIASGI